MPNSDMPIIQNLVYVNDVFHHSPDTSNVNSMPIDQLTLTRNDRREFVCGWGAAFINISVTFPVNKVMFRQMLDGISTARAIKQLRLEGPKYLYRGIFPVLCQKTLTTSVMFGMYDQYSRQIAVVCPFMPEEPRLAMAAMLAGCSEALLCPFERIQTLLQDPKFYAKYRNSLHTARALQQFGFREYYRGIGSVLLRNGPSNILFFGLRHKIRDCLPLPSGNAFWGNILVDFVSGAFLGAFISTLMYPINVVKTHQQSLVGGRFISFTEALRFVYRSRGGKFTRLFSGVHVNYTRALISWGIINASYELLLLKLYS